MNRAEKANVIEALKVHADKAPLAFVTDLKGMKVEEMTALRVKLRETNAHYQVVKNTLARIALDGGPHEVLKEHLKENCAIAFSDDDAVAMAKALVEYAKTNKKFVMRFGSLEGSYLDAKALDDLAKLPGRPELLAKLLGTMNAVPTNFACLFANLLRSFLYALTAIKEDKEKNAA